MGRLAEDTAELAERAAFTEILAEELGCLEGPKAFPPIRPESLPERKACLAGGELYDDTWGEVVLMCGLPGTGKDTWIREHYPGLPVVSLDEIRREMKVSCRVPGAGGG